MKIKELKDQVIVITGPTSGIGLVTARQASRAGARLVLAARDETSLRQLTDEIKRAGGDATYIVADVADEDQVRSIAETAIQHYGGFDTWVNNAGLAIYGELWEVPIKDHRQLFDINFWGIVYGSLEAARHFRQRGGDYKGVIINLGSTVSDRAIPLQSMYSVSKHAVKGFTDALRMELQHEGTPIEICLIKPGAIATPFPEHARNYMKEEPTLPPPVYAPNLVAEAILKCAVAPQRDVFVGGSGKMMGMLGTYFPGLGDKLLGPSLFRQQKKDEPAKDRPDSLYQPGFGMKERGDVDRQVFETSPYTKIVTSPVLKGVLLLGTLMAFATVQNRRSK